MEALLAGVLLVVTYLVAAVPFGLVMTTWWGGAEVDLRDTGSGNIGATNVARTHGWRLALAVLALDAAKGAAPVLLAGWLLPAWTTLPGLAALVAFAGHCWPVYLGFRGGKGVATAAGALLALSPWATLVACVAWGAALAWQGRASVASLVAAVTLVVAALLLDLGHLPVVLAIAAGIGLTHRANVRRLARGTESTVAPAARRVARAPLTADQALAQGPAGLGAGPPAWRGPHDASKSPSSPSG